MERAKKDCGEIRHVQQGNCGDYEEDVKDGVTNSGEMLLPRTFEEFSPTDEK